MKVLFYRAVAGHPSVAPALMGQAANTLRPFNRFIGQAIHTAKERQFRYALPWEKVRHLSTFRLEPVDTRLRIPRRQPGWILPQWPTERTPDTGQMGFIINRGLPVKFNSATPAPRGLIIQSHTPLLPTDVLMWCGVQSSISLEAAVAPPSQFQTLEGKPLKVLRPPEPLDGDFWSIVLERIPTESASTHASPSDLLLLADGEEVEAQGLPPFEGLKRVTDTAGNSFEVSEAMLRLEEPPADGVLRGDNGLRFRWAPVTAQERKGLWIQLLPPDKTDTDELLDPRVAFCEDEVDEVWTSKSRRQDDIYKVRKVDRERFQLLLDRLPPPGTQLFLPVDLRNLYLQKRALRQLSESPLPHHQGLLRLCEDPTAVRWPEVKPVSLSRWYVLTDETRDGTREQRAFVCKALGSPDFAYLEGPPGSGKTTAICELILQLIERQQRVLLCGSTHAAIDNVIERLLGKENVEVVRIGKPDKVDDKVLACQLDEKVEALTQQWLKLPAMQHIRGDELRAMAERMIILSANLTCGTTMGIVNHPHFRGRDQDLHVAERPITTLPHWDVLIIDEASKTLIQEFMVPALMARRHIIVGDVHQLPPFADRADIVANLRELVDEKDRPLFPRDHQRACLLLHRLLRRDLLQNGLRWLIVEPAGVLKALVQELDARPEAERPERVLVELASGKNSSGAVVSLQELKAGGGKSSLTSALRLLAAQWILVPDTLLPEVAPFLPPNLLFARELVGTGAPLREENRLLFRQAVWLTRLPGLQHPYRERKFQRDPITTPSQAQQCEQHWLAHTDLAQELAWRLTRQHELRHSQNKTERERLQRDLKVLQPRSLNIAESLAEIQDIGLPSILEVLQEGIGVERSNRPSALTEGMGKRQSSAFHARFERLDFQHRMHPQISDFPRDVIYRGGALKDANTILSRDECVRWDFGAYPARRTWLHVQGRESSGENPDEIRAIQRVLEDFIRWVKVNGPPARLEPRVWEVACLCFYVKQERALSKMLRELTGDDRFNRFTVRGLPIELVCGTVDRFQGREADLVLLSMRNTQRVGFLDSPNRLNVAVTRARQQLIVVGNAAYFEECHISELENLVKRSPQMEAPKPQVGRRPRA